MPPALFLIHANRYDPTPDGAAGFAGSFAAHEPAAGAPGSADTLNAALAEAAS